MWDMVSNFHNITHARRVGAAIQVFELFRVMGFLWVVIGHEFAYRLTFAQNYIDAGFLDYTKNSWPFTNTEIAFYAVDMFLFIGGYVSILTVSRYVNSFPNLTVLSSPFVFLYLAAKRYARIMPAYAAMLLWFVYVGPHLTEGPTNSVYAECSQKKFWQSFALGWNTDMTGKNILCAGWCWYLAVDFQLFLTVPIICLLVG